MYILHATQDQHYTSSLSFPHPLLSFSINNPLPSHPTRRPRHCRRHRLPAHNGPRHSHQRARNNMRQRSRSQQLLGPTAILLQRPRLVRDGPISSHRMFIRPSPPPPPPLPHYHIPHLIRLIRTKNRQSTTSPVPATTASSPKATAAPATFFPLHRPVASA